MFLDQETLRLIFGLKLRTLRTQRDLSLKDVAARTGLSVSYVNEIEQGKKYPKTDKVLLLARALDVRYEDLTSLQLDQELGVLKDLLENNIFQGLPFDIMGIPAQTLVRVLSERPQQVKALFATVVELTRQCNLTVDDFFASTLRAYLSSHQNYFPELETVAQHIRKRIQSPTPTNLALRLKENYSTKVEEKSFQKLQKGLHDIYFMSNADPRRRHIILNQELSEREKTFILAKEIAHLELGSKERFFTNRSHHVDSFEKIQNNFKASYIAGAVLMPQEDFLTDVKRLFKQKEWSATHFLQWIQSYPGTLESVLHRMTQILPTFLKIEKIFFLGFTHHEKTKRFEMKKELHLSDLHAPHGVKNMEHYCRRWITVSLIEKLIDSKKVALAGAQKSSYAGSDQEYLCLSMARTDELKPFSRTCFTVGLLVNDRSREVIRFLDDPKIPLRTVAATCEQCPLDDCEERVAEPFVVQEKAREELIQRTLESSETWA